MSIYQSVIAGSGISGATGPTGPTGATGISVTGATGSTGPTGSMMKNRIINGAMVIDQRNAGASVTNISSPSNFAYTVDRFGYWATQASKFTAQQSSTAPVGFTNSLKITSLSAYTVLSTDYFTIGQCIEGFNVADLNWGTANAKTVTISFWVQASLTGTFGGALSNGSTNRSYAFSYTISSANTWQQVSITIAGDTTGTWNTVNSTGLIVTLGLGCGSTATGSTGSWAGAWYASANSSTNIVSTSGATFYITGVQLEVGSSATGFEYRMYTTELELCERYFWKTSGALGLPSIGAGFVISTTDARVNVQHPVSMRSIPTYAYSGNLYILGTGGAGITVTGIVATYPGYLSSMIQFGAGAGGLVSGSGTLVICDNATSNYFTASAEL